ncbi:MAG: polymer-forming cytoskeletal protein [bacterium]|nr:polymer-forming cytoskeletal protein [bacterium]
MFKKDAVHEGGIQDTVIAQGVKVEGDFVCEGTITVQGEVHGTVRTERDLQVGEQARIVADVWAQNAIISGEVQGNMKIAERLELTPTSKVNGDIEVKTLVIAPGAVLNGRCNMTGEALQPAGMVLNERRRTGRARMVMAAEPPNVEEREN